jgi:CHAT domain-containing protein
MYGKMKRIYSFSFVIFFATQCLCQNLSPDVIVSKLSEYVTNARFEEANDYFQNNHKGLDQTTADIFSSVINIGLDSQGKPIDVDANITCIKRLLNEFSQHKEELRGMSTGMMPYFNIYVSYLSKISSPVYLDVYKLFKEIWPTIDSENAQTYIYVLENTSIQTFVELKYNEAIPIFEELIELGNQGHKLSSRPYANYAYLGRCYQNTGNDEKAAIFYDKSLTLFSPSDKINEPITYINVVRDRYEVALKLSHLTKCIELGEILTRFYDNKAEYTQDYINVSISLAEIELSMHKTSEGIKNYENGVKYILTSENYDKESRKAFLNNLYTLYNTSEIKEENRKFKEYRDKYKIVNVGKLEPAVMDEHYVDSLWSVVNKQNENMEQIDVRSYTDAINSLARYYGNRKQELYAIQLLEKTIDYYKKTNITEQSYAILYISLGSIYSLVYNTDKANVSYKTALQIYEKNGMYNADFVDILCYLADNYLQSEELVTAKAYLEEAQDVSKNMSAFSTEKTIYYHLLRSFSELYKKMEDEEKALSYNASIIDDIIKNDGDEMIKKTFQVARINILMYFDKYNDAYKLMENIGPDYFHYFQDWLTPFNVKFFNNDITCERELEKLTMYDYQNLQRLYSSFDLIELSNYWDIIGGNLNFAYSMTLDRFESPSLCTSTYNNLLITKNFQLELKKYEKRHKDSKFSDDVVSNVLNSLGNVNTISNSLKDDEVAIEFFIVNHRISFKKIEKKYGALVLKKNVASPVFIELCDCDSLGQFLYTNTLGEAELYADRIYGTNNDRLYKLIWEPIEKEIPVHSKVYISGCEAILFVNFSAISNGKNRLDDLYDIHNVISTSAILSNKKENRAYETAILFGGIDYDTPLRVMSEESAKYSQKKISEQYALLRGQDERGSWGKLQYSLEEINSIATYLSENHLSVTKYTQSEASEEAFKSLSGSSPDIIHISTHGFYYQPYSHSYLSDYSNQYFTNENNNKLNFNGLLFSGANNAWRYSMYKDNVEDGVLTAKEIYSMDLSNTDLLILSACQTGLGESNEIDGNEGLSKAFKIAGVNDMIITLWNVSDEATSIFMQIFYKKLIQTKEPRRALKETIYEIKKEMPDPYYWAGFIMLE